MTDLTRVARSRRGGRRPGWGLLTALLVLAIAASSALVFTDRVELLKLAVILSLWAAVVAAFVSVIYRRQSDLDQARARDLKLVYDLQLDREISARREYELTVESQLRHQLASELRAQAADEVASLRAELAALRTNLEILFDADLGHRPAIETERTTVLAYSDWARDSETTGRVSSSRIDAESEEEVDVRTEESPIIDVPAEPHPSEPEWASTAGYAARTAGRRRSRKASGMWRRSRRRHRRLRRARSRSRTWSRSRSRTWNRSRSRSRTWSRAGAGAAPGTGAGAGAAPGTGAGAGAAPGTGAGAGAAPGPSRTWSRSRAAPGTGASRRAHAADRVAARHSGRPMDPRGNAGQQLGRVRRAERIGRISTAGAGPHPSLRCPSRLQSRAVATPPRRMPPTPDGPHRRPPWPRSPHSRRHPPSRPRSRLPPRHRSPDESAGGQSVAELLARLQATPTGGGGRRRRED